MTTLRLYTKQALSIADQIALLKNRGLQIADESKATKFLGEVSYFRFVQYLRPMEADKATHQFKQNSRFEDAVALYEFDIELRDLMFRAISMKGKTNPAYGLSAGWSQAGWKLEAGAKNLLTKTKAIHQWYDVGSYAYDSHSRSDSYGPQVYVKMSYSFDFGRKVKRQQIKADDAPQSGILKL